MLGQQRGDEDNKCDQLQHSDLRLDCYPERTEFTVLIEVNISNYKKEIINIKLFNDPNLHT